MANFSLSDCFTFGLVLLFLFGALAAGPSNFSPIDNHIYRQLRHKFLLEKQEGVIEQFTSPGKVLGNVNPDMLKLYNSESFII